MGGSSTAPVCRSSLSTSGFCKTMSDSKRLRMLRLMQSKWLQRGRECPAVLRELLESADRSWETLTKKQFESVMYKLRCDLRPPDETVEDSLQKASYVSSEREVERKGVLQVETSVSAYVLVLPEQNFSGELATAWLCFWL